MNMGHILGPAHRKKSVLLLIKEFASDARMPYREKVVNSEYQKLFFISSIINAFDEGSVCLYR